MTRLCLWLSAIVVLGGCSVPTGDAPKKEIAPDPVVRPADESRRFPKQDLVTVEIVDNHLLGKDFLPGGNVAEYSAGGSTYQLFLAGAKSAESAALLMFDYKNALSGARYLAHMGGYFGMDGEQPVYVFAKDKWVAGIVGLPEAEADPLARDFAARLN